MSQTQRFSRRALAIALAAGTAFGSVTVTTPSASAIGGYTPDEMMLNTPERDNYTTWGFLGGYVRGVPVKNGKVNGFSTGTGQNALSIFTHEGWSGEGHHGYYSDPIALDSVVVSGGGIFDEYGVSSVPLSMDLKKLIYVIALINNDIVENNGLSQDVKDVFAHVGYKPTNTPNGYIGMFGENYGLNDTHKKSLEYIKTLEDEYGNKELSYATQADIVAGASSSLFTYIFNYGTNIARVGGPHDLKDPFSFTLDQFRDESGVSSIFTDPNSSVIELAFGLTPSGGEAGQKAADTAAFFNALLAISELVPDEAVKNDSVMLRHYVPVGDEVDSITPNEYSMPRLIDFEASNIPPVTTLLPGNETPEPPEPETPKPGIEDAIIKEVRDNKDGTYTLIRNDGTEVDSVIDTSGAVTKITTDGKGNLVVTIDGKDQTVPLDKVKVTESNKGTKNHTVTITTPDGTPVVLDAYDNFVTDVTKDEKTGNYIVTRNDGQTWTIHLKDIRDQITALEKKKSPTRAEFDAAKKEVDALTNKLNDLDKVGGAAAKTLDQLSKDIAGLNDRLGVIDAELDRLNDQDVKEVRDNKDGTYTLIRNNGDEVKGKIDTSGNVTNIASDGKGNLVITINGKDQTVPLDQVKVVEANKGQKNHTVTITTPDGKKVILDAYDNHVTSVKKQANGDYIVTRNDGTSWPIVLKDIRDQIAALEKKKSPTKAEFDALSNKLNTIKTKVDAEFKRVDGRITGVEGDVDALNKDLDILRVRVDSMEARLGDVEDRTDAVTKCLYGAGDVGIGTLIALPLFALTQMNLPGVRDMNNQIQQQLGLYDANLARLWGETGGVAQLGAVLAGAAGVIGAIAHLSKECQPLSNTKAAQETNLGRMSSQKVGADVKANKAKVVKPEADKDRS